MSAPAPAPTTAAQLVDMLRRHHLPEGRPASGVLAAEIAAPDSPRRADALWLPLTETGGGLEGYELKCSRADVLNELADPMKADAWAKYCTRWWLLVAHPTLIDGLEVPEQWGVMAPPSGRRTRSMTVLREAPRLRPHDTAPAHRRILSWYFHRTDPALREALRDRDRHSERADALQRQLWERPTTAERTSPHFQRVAEIIRRTEDAASVEWLWDGVDDDDVVTALLDTARVRHATTAHTRHLEQTLERFATALAPVTAVTDALQRLHDGAPPTPRTRRTR